MVSVVSGGSILLYRTAMTSDSHAGGRCLAVEIYRQNTTANQTLTEDAVSDYISGSRVSLRPCQEHRNNLAADSNDSDDSRRSDMEQYGTVSMHWSLSSHRLRLIQTDTIDSLCLGVPVSPSRIVGGTANISLSAELKVVPCNSNSSLLFFNFKF